MVIQRQHYLDSLIRKRENGLIKIITGLRRSGKSYLLFNLYYDYLLQTGVKPDHIITLSLESDLSIKYRNPLELSTYLHQLVSRDKDIFYVFLDEIQMVESVVNPYVPSGKKVGFTDVLLGLMRLPNVDIYVTGSNSKMLSSDVATEFRGRGDEVKIYPLSFEEYYAAYSGDKNEAWREYCVYGGMPYILSFDSHEGKSKYLNNLLFKVYVSDVLERYKVLNDREMLDDLLRFMASSVGSFTSTSKLANTFKSVKNINVQPATLHKYLSFFKDAFLVNEIRRYDIKGRKYIGSPTKYYFADLGLRNACLNFRQLEENHIMENCIYNELVYRGYSVDVGMQEYNFKNSEGKSCRTQLEVDFVATKGYEVMYVQSAFAMENMEKQEQEIRPLRRVGNSFKKVVVSKDCLMPYVDEWGIHHVDLQSFLLHADTIL